MANHNGRFPTNRRAFILQMVMAIRTARRPRLPPRWPSYARTKSLWGPHFFLLLPIDLLQMLDSEKGNLYITLT